MLNRRRRRREEFEADRALGRIVAICATVLTVPAFAPAIEQWADLALWWSIPALTVVAGLLLLAVFGRELPPRLTTALWLVLPLAVLALLLLGYAAYSGTANNGRFPWVWWFAPGTSALVALAVRPASAVALTTLGAFAPALSYLVFRGEANLVLVGAGMLHLSDLALVLIVIATRERLHSLFEAEARALRSHVRSLQARARKLKAESRARLVHDEVLQTLIAAGRVPQPSPELAAAASRSLAALAPHSTHPPSAQEDRLPNDVAARRGASPPPSPTCRRASPSNSRSRRGRYPVTPSRHSSSRRAKRCATRSGTADAGCGSTASCCSGRAAPRFTCTTTGLASGSTRFLPTGSGCAAACSAECGISPAAGRTYRATRRARR